MVKELLELPNDQHTLEQLEDRLLLSVSLDPSGWTVVGPAADTRVVYVSSQFGDDNNDGLSPATAVASLDRGEDLIRDGMADWLLLRCGDVFDETFGTWDKSGRSADEPLLISNYGDPNDPRPVILTGTDNGFETRSTKEISNIAIIGLDFYADDRDPNGGGGLATGFNNGIRWRAGGENLLIEDTLLRFHGWNIDFHSIRGYDNFTMRRSQILDAYSVGGDSHGLYMQNVSGITLEENIFDHNGYNEDVAGAHASSVGRDQNVYIQVENSPIVAQGNVFARGGSTGLQARTGGIVDNNLFIANPSGLTFGNVLGAQSPVPGGVTGSVVNNVLLNGNDIPSDPEIPTGIGMWIGNIAEGQLSNNLLVDDISSEDYGKNIRFEGDNGVGVNNLTVSGNVDYEWRGGFDFRDGDYSNVVFQENTIQQFDSGTTVLRVFESEDLADISFLNNRYWSEANPSNWFQVPQFDNKSFADFVNLSGETGVATQVGFTDATRDAETFDSLLGGAGTLESFLDGFRNQRKDNFNVNYTAAVFNDYMREGFDIETIGVIGITTSFVHNRPIDFDNLAVGEYGENQHDPNNSVVSTFEDGLGLSLQGNAWIRVERPYFLTPDTVLEFEFRSPEEAEIQAIGFDDDLVNSTDRRFLLYGTDSDTAAGIQDYNTYGNNPGAWRKYRIRVGEHYTGQMEYLFFVNDNDASPTQGISEYRNIKLYEEPVNFNNFLIDPYNNVNIIGDTDMDGDVDTADLNTAIQNFTGALAPGVGNKTVADGDTDADGDVDTIDVTEILQGFTGQNGEAPPTGSFFLEDAGYTIRLAGNAWRSIHYPFLVTEDTFLEFEFKSNGEAEISGIGVDENGRDDLLRMFQIDGSENYINAIQDFNGEYDGNENQWVQYAIPIGDYYTGIMQNVFFVNDNDVEPSLGQTSFRNVTLVDRPRIDVDFREYVIESYSDQDIVGTNQVSIDGSTLVLQDNTWKKIALPYEVTEYTILEFSFFSFDQAEVHGIGFDDDNDETDLARIFQVWGTELEAYAITDYNDYGPFAGTFRTYQIPVGQFYTGPMEYLTFINDSDGSPNNGASFFQNVAIYEDPTFFV